jgi:hypothetical protein
MTAPAPGSHITWDCGQGNFVRWREMYIREKKVKFLSVQVSTMRFSYHITAQLCGCHGGEVRRS